MIICFDVDECLIDHGRPVDANIKLLKIMAKSHRVYMWSGNGYEHAYDIAKQLGLITIISGVLTKYHGINPDITFDNQEIQLGKVNIKV
jgi:hydroxymethylpyrimidine pyrophosphatase-like HAD family hydrolase